MAEEKILLAFGKCGWGKETENNKSSQVTPVLHIGPQTAVSVGVIVAERKQILLYSYRRVKRQQGCVRNAAEWGFRVIQHD